MTRPAAYAIALLEDVQNVGSAIVHRMLSRHVVLDARAELRAP